jgi:transaldolase
MIESHEMQNIRVLFASTGVKGDNLPANYYITGLMASHSINTAPLATIEAHLKSNDKKVALPIDDSILNGYFTNLKDNGFSIDEIAKELLDDGLSAFEDAFKDMLESLED